MATKVLTKEFIISKCNTDRLSEIKNLNMWGNDLDDLTALKDLPNVEIISLSINKISTLMYFQQCKKLTELYLRKNLIQDLSEIKYLVSLPQLKVLWLSHNPCADHPNYRQYVIKCLPNLIKLDSSEITQEERSNAKNLNIDFFTQQENQRHATPSPQLQKKPSASNVLQQNISAQNHYQSKSPLRSHDSRDNQAKKSLQTVDSSSSSKTVFKQKSMQQKQKGSEQRNENILCAVLALLKELGESELELVKRDIEKKLVIQKQQN